MQIDRRSFASLTLATSFAPVAAGLQDHADAVKDAAEATVGRQSSGMVFAARQGRVVWSGPVGKRSLLPPDVGRQTAFDILSGGKLLTAVAVMRLVDMNLVVLNRELRTYLTDLPETWAGMRIRHLLNNDTGLPVYLDGDDFVPRTADQAFAEIAAGAIERPGGSGYRYSNTTFQLLGLLVQHLFGAPYADAIRALVLKPLGMTRTDVMSAARWTGESVATGWVDGLRTGSPETWPNTWSLLGAAGWATTVEDLYRLNRAIAGDAFLSRLSRERMFTGGVPTYGRGPVAGVGAGEITSGCGMFHWLDEAGRRIAFSGGDGDFGFHFASAWRRDDDLYVAALLNSATTGQTIDRKAFLDAMFAALA